MDTFFFLFDRCCCSWGDAKVHGFFGKGSGCGELAHDGLVIEEEEGWYRVNVLMCCKKRCRCWFGKSPGAGFGNVERFGGRTFLTAGWSDCWV